MKDDKKKSDKKKSLIDPSKLNAHPKQVIKGTSKKSNISNTDNTSNTGNTSNKKRMGPIPATPAHWIKSGVKLNPDSIDKIKKLIVDHKKDLQNRDIVVEKALQDFFKKYKV